MSRRITLLGPQPRSQLQRALGELDPDAVVATINAGWQEREVDDAELAEAIGFRTVNLALHARLMTVYDEDREYAHAEREHEAALAELRQLYLVQLDHALGAAYEVARRSDARPRLRERALTDALQVVKLLDEQHLDRMTEYQLKFFDAWRPQERPAVARQRDEIHHLLGTSSAVAISGGHVGVLTRVLHLFHLAPHLPERVVAWSAGAMALTDRVVLFHDFVPHGVAQTEVYGTGIGVVPGVVALPHARRRLQVNDHVHMSVLARRFAPAHCLVLDDSTRVPLDEEGAAAAGRAGAGRRGAHRHDRGGMKAGAPKRKLAINRLRERKPLDDRTVDRFLARNEVPIVEGSRCTFLFRGEADEVRLAQRVVGLPGEIPMKRLHGTDLWYLVLELPEGSRVNYQLEVRRGEHVERINDPLNPKISYSPVGTSSVCFGHGYESPGVDRARPARAPGHARGDRGAEPGPASRLPGHRLSAGPVPAYVDVPAAGGARRPRLPPVRRLQDRARQPDPPLRGGRDRGRLPAPAGPADRVHQLDRPLALPHPGAHPPPGDQPAADGSTLWSLPARLQPRRRRVPVGGGEVAEHLRLADPDVGSFVFTDIGTDHGGGPVFDPVVKFMNRYRAKPTRVADRLFMSCGIYEPLIAPNRSMVPTFESTGMTTRFVETRDGHNWENWRDTLRDALSWVYPGDQKFVYE